MADPGKSKSKSQSSVSGEREGFPSNEELLHELRLHGAKPATRPPPAVSRRTRDYLLVAGLGSAVIASGVFYLMGDAALVSAVKLALTGIVLFCGLSWFIFFGVMSRY